MSDIICVYFYEHGQGETKACEAKKQFRCKMNGTFYMIVNII